MMPSKPRRRKSSDLAFGVTLFGLAVFMSQLFFLVSLSPALETPGRTFPINDLAGMMPQASYDELKQTMTRFKTQTGHTVAVLTLRSLADRKLDDVGSESFTSLPLGENELRKTVLLVIARKEHR